MRTLEGIREALPGYARDLQLNLGSVLTPAGAPGLSERQIWAVALAAALASRNAAFSRELQALAAPHLDAAHVTAAHAAAAIMGMNNVYYRFLHLVEDPEYAKLPARLRMNVLAAPASRKRRLRAAVARGVGDQRLRHLRRFPRAPAARARADARGGAERGAYRRDGARGRARAGERRRHRARSRSLTAGDFSDAPVAAGGRAAPGTIIGAACPLSRTHWPLPRCSRSASPPPARRRHARSRTTSAGSSKCRGRRCAS